MDILLDTQILLWLIREFGEFGDVEFGDGIRAEFENVVDKLYELKHSHSALLSVQHRMSICPPVLLFQLMISHIH